MDFRNRLVPLRRKWIGLETWYDCIMELWRAEYWTLRATEGLTYSSLAHSMSPESNMLKGIVHPKNSVIIYSPTSSSKPVWMSLFCWTQRKIFWRMWVTEQFWGTIDFHSIFFPAMEVNGAPKQPGYKLFSKYLPLCLAEQRNSYRFGTTWGWVNDDRIFIFGWTIPLRRPVKATEGSVMHSPSRRPKGGLSAWYDCFVGSRDGVLNSQSERRTHKLGGPGSGLLIGDPPSEGSTANSTIRAGTWWERQGTAC